MRTMRRIRLPCLTVLASIAAVWAMGAQTPAAGDDAVLVRARALVVGGRYGEAEQSLRGLLAGESRSAPAMFLLGYVLELERRPKESLAWFTKAAALATPTGEDLRIVALDYVQLNDYADAVHWLERGVELDPINSETWYDLGRARMMLSDFAGALAPLRKALELHPRSVKAENNLGVVYAALNEAAKAAEAYRLAIAWQQDQARPSEQPLLNYGKLLIDEQRSKEALPLLVQAAGIAPGDPKCRAALARAYDELGEYGKAVAEMEEAVRLDANNARLHYQLGQMYRRAGDAEKAKRELLLSGKLYGSRSSEPVP